MAKKPTGRLVGYGTCTGCGCEKIEVREYASGNGLLYYNCPTVADGGCQKQEFTRSKKSTEIVARTVVKRWVDAETRARFLGEKKPAPAPKAETPPPATEADDAPASEPKKKKSWLDVEV